jgi:outer membrane protein
MKSIKAVFVAGTMMVAFPSVLSARQWTLQECIDYALQHNISIQKTNVQRRSAHEDVLQSQAALLPSLSASTSQNVNYTPWVSSGVISTDGYSRSSVDKLYYNGTYSVSGNWTVWNGNRNRNTVKLNKLTEEAAALDSAVQARTIEEQIAQLYVQILYSTEAIEVNRESLKTSTANENRGKEMVQVGKMSRVDLSQLTAQRAQDEYNVVAAESQVKEYKRQLKKLLQITSEEEFDVVIPATTDEMALQEIPTMTSIYDAALENRPELKSYRNAIEQSDMSIKIARAGKMPSVGVNAGVSTSTTSMNKNGWGSQLKTNFSAGAGVTVSVPLIDNRQTKTAINKAMLQRENAMLDLKNTQTTLYANIESFWLQANTQQNQFKAAKVSVESAQTSYDMLNEKFRLGLANITDLMKGKDTLLTAKQNELQAKYMTILNLDMLRFYQTGQLTK